MITCTHVLQCKTLNVTVQNILYTCFVNTLHLFLYYETMFTSVEVFKANVTSVVTQSAHVDWRCHRNVATSAALKQGHHFFGWDTRLIVNLVLFGVLHNIH